MEKTEKQFDEYPWENRVAKMNREEIFHLFERYGFEDKHGHPLANCADFRDLVDRAISAGAA